MRRNKIKPEVMEQPLLYTGIDIKKYFLGIKVIPNYRHILNKDKILIKKKMSTPTLPNRGLLLKQSINYTVLRKRRKLSVMPISVLVIV